MGRLAGRHSRRQYFVFSSATALLITASAALAQSDSKAASTAQQSPTSSTCGCDTKPKPKRPSSKANSCGNPATATCELQIGLRFLEARQWADASKHCATSITLNSTLVTAVDCLKRAEDGLNAERENRINDQLDIVLVLLRKSPDAAQKELDSVRLDEKQNAKRPASPELKARIQRVATDVAQRRYSEWPNNLPRTLGVSSWLPDIVSTVAKSAGTVLFFAGCLWLAYWLLNQIRLLAGFFIFWRGRTFRGGSRQDPVIWYVASIADDTKQSAAGALVDSLNVRFNVLFEQLYTSSFLALPPALGGLLPGAHGRPPMLRNFQVNGSELPGVRPYGSARIEDLDRSKFERHVFRQADVFEDISVKLGVIEGSLGAILRNIQRWWYKGRPSVTGSVGFEDVDKTRFASIRLVAHYGDEKPRVLKQVAPPSRPGQVMDGLRELFSKEQTFSVFASTKVDESADAVYLASQRAAFRLLYRLVLSPSEPGLAIAASSFRQGVRLLNIII